MKLNICGPILRREDSLDCSTKNAVLISQAEVTAAYKKALDEGVMEIEFECDGKQYVFSRRLDMAFLRVGEGKYVRAIPFRD